MSTRAVIARPVGDAFVGRYHHFDGYPTGLGAALYELATTQFKGKLSKMLETLIDKHPAGWSTIMSRNGAADFSIPPGYVNMDSRRDEWENKQAKCYCHGDRHEEAQEVKSTDPETWCEWAYVINAERQIMTVMAEGGGGWNPVAVVDLRSPEPNWEEIEQAGDLVRY